MAEKSEHDIVWLKSLAEDLASDNGTGEDMAMSFAGPSRKFDIDGVHMKSSPRETDHRHH